MEVPPDVIIKIRLSKEKMKRIFLEWMITNTKDDLVDLTLQDLTEAETKDNKDKKT